MEAEEIWKYGSRDCLHTHATKTTKWIIDPDPPGGDGKWTIAPGFHFHGCIENISSVYRWHWFKTSCKHSPVRHWLNVYSTVWPVASALARNTHCVIYGHGNDLLRVETAGENGIVKFHVSRSRQNGDMIHVSLSRCMSNVYKSSRSLVRCLVEYRFTEVQAWLCPGDSRMT